MLKLTGKSKEAPATPNVAPPPPLMSPPTGAVAPAPAAQPAAAPVVTGAPVVTPTKRTPGTVSAPPRQRNTAIMVAGAALILFAGAIAFSVAKSFDDSVQVLVANRGIVEGELIGEDDFRSVSIAAGSGAIEAVSPEDLVEIVGRRAAGPIGEGTLIHPTQFLGGAGVEEDILNVGAVLAPNRFPAEGLRAGDRVRIYEVSDGISSIGSDEPTFSAATEITVAEITAVGIVGNGNTGEIHVSLDIPESATSVVTDRAANNLLAVALLDTAATLDLVQPLDAAKAVEPLDVEPGQ